MVVVTAVAAVAAVAKAAAVELEGRAALLQGCESIVNLQRLVHGLRFVATPPGRVRWRPLGQGARDPGVCCVSQLADAQARRTHALRHEELELGGSITTTTTPIHTQLAHLGALLLLQAPQRRPLQARCSSRAPPTAPPVKVGLRQIAAPTIDL